MQMLGTETHQAGRDMQPQPIYHPLCCLFPFSQTLWFDLHQRLSDSESTACTVSMPDHHPWVLG